MEDVSDHTDDVACRPSEQGGGYACGGESLLASQRLRGTHLLRFTPTQALADEFNEGFTALKNHEMIHLRQAQACGDSWLRFYFLYLWYSLRALPMCRKMKRAAYLLNPFEIEAYRHMNDLNYLSNGEATEWRKYAKMPLKERLKLFNKNKKSLTDR